MESLESRSLLAGDLLGLAGDFNAVNQDAIDSVGMYDPHSAARGSGTVACHAGSGHGEQYLSPGSGDSAGLGESS